MICPKCHKESLLFNESLSGIVWNRKKTITHYCLNCGYEIEKVFKLNEDMYQAELNKIKKTNYNVYETKKEQGVWNGTG